MRLGFFEVYPGQIHETGHSFAMPSLLEREIADACEGTAAGTKARMQALAQVRWVLATDNGMFVMVDSIAHARLTEHLSEATIYDGRDNETLKCRFMESLLRVSLFVVLLLDND